MDIEVGKNLIINFFCCIKNKLHKRECLKNLDTKNFEYDKVFLIKWYNLQRDNEFNIFSYY